MYSIQPATLCDIRAIYQLEREIFPKDAYPYVDLAMLLSMPGMTNYKATASEAATSPNSLLGFVAMSGAGVGQRPAWIITLGVANHAQRRGIGEALMHAVESRSRAKCLQLTVRAGNQAARQLYEKLGYSFVNRHRGYYRDGEDGLIMQKRLQP